ncbi:MAG: hypothetical protein IJ485_00355 [Lachnospiraceae bacterium]|nr:hypothetical protein [Lachnospiraceae bacterium]
MEYVIFAAAMVVLLVIFTMKGFLDDRKGRQLFVKELQNHYGKLPEREYKPEMYEAIAKYYHKHQKDGQIDDITWNDLDMDQIFKIMNHTLSSAGAEYLYYTLRTPKVNKAEFARMEEQIVYFMEHEEERLTLQKLFMELGTMGKYSLYDYLDYLGNLGKRSNRKHHVANLCMLLAVLSCFIIPSYGMLVLIAVVIFNISTYLKDKKDIEPYIISLSYIMRLLQITDKLQKTKIEVIQEEQEKLIGYRKKFNQFTRNSFLVMADTSSNGNPFDVFFIYMKMIFHVDLIKFNQMLASVRNQEEEIDQMLTIVGYIETLISIGAFRASMQTYAIPEFIDENKIEAKQIYHPLITHPVKNDIVTERGVLLTGSNASGKSTFLKTIALNAILAQTIHCVLADKYVAPFFRIYSSMALRDDLTGGDSYYIVEIKALRRVLKAAKEQSDLPVLCFVDEVLRGTNTVERIAASMQILKSLAQDHVMCFAATHDIELTHLLEAYYDNYHFKEEIEDNDVLFSYKLLEGRSTTRNAIKLLGIMGYEETLINEAEKMATTFLTEGNWKVESSDIRKNNNDER